MAAGLSCVDLPLEACSVTVNGKTESQLLHQPEPIAETPISKLKNALSSKKQFEQHYLVILEDNNTETFVKHLENLALN